MDDVKVFILCPDDRGWHPDFKPKLVEIIDRSRVPYSLVEKKDRMEVSLLKVEPYEVRYLLKLIQRGGYEVAIDVSNSRPKRRR
jgi:hypothetical protein